MSTSTGARLPRMTSSLGCAIYTRKSNEEGLEQSFNSLHAQREACEAFIQSQGAEGWRLLPDRYEGSLHRALTAYIEHYQG